MATITEDFVSFETAKLLKEKGFDEFTFSDYNENGIAQFNEVETRVTKGYQRPTLQMAMKWLREMQNISIEPFVDFGSSEECWWTADVGYIKKDGLVTELCGYDSYEDACEGGIKYCLKNLI